MPGATYTPTLYSLGPSLEAWAGAALKLAKGNHIIVVGCSVGGSCALEIAVAAPNRVAALVLIGTKARHKPDAAFHASALETLREKGVEAAWDIFWAPLFSRSVNRQVIEDARRIALRQSALAIACGVGVFHSRPNRDGLLSMFPAPVIVITGADDSAPGLKVSAAQASSAPHGQLHVVPDCGHYVPLERPEHLNSILRGVIASLR